MKLGLKMYTKTFGLTTIILTTVTIQKTASIMIQQTKKLLVDSKMRQLVFQLLSSLVWDKKMYPYTKDNNKNANTAKGIKKYVIKKNLHHQNYKDTLFNNKQIRHKMKTIRSVRHQLGSYKLNKISLSCFDDKRYIHDNGQRSYAYGHYQL